MYAWHNNIGVATNYLDFIIISKNILGVLTLLSPLKQSDETSMLKFNKTQKPNILG